MEYGRANKFASEGLAATVFAGADARSAGHRALPLGNQGALIDIIIRVSLTTDSGYADIVTAQTTQGG